MGFASSMRKKKNTKAKRERESEKKSDFPFSVFRVLTDKRIIFSLLASSSSSSSASTPVVQSASDSAKLQSQLREMSETPLGASAASASAAVAATATVSSTPPPQTTTPASESTHIFDRHHHQRERFHTPMSAGTPSVVAALAGVNMSSTKDTIRASRWVREGEIGREKTASS